MKRGGGTKAMTKFPNRLRLVAVAAALAIGSSNLWAEALLTGSMGGGLNLSNMTGALVGVTSACINWQYNIDTTCQTATGVQDSVSGTDTTLFAVGSTATDTIKDIPAGVATPLVDFETVAGGSGGAGEVFFDLTSVTIPGAFGNCASGAVNNSCNAGGGSPFILTQNTSNQVTVSFSASLDGYTGTSATGTTPYSAVFSTTFSGTLANGMPDTIPNILNYVATGGVLQSTWSAAESPVPSSGTPEPMTFVLLGSGLVGLSVVRKRRSRI